MWLKAAYRRVQWMSLPALVCICTPAASQDLCKGLKYAIGESKNGYQRSKSVFSTSTLDSFGGATDGIPTSINMGIFDTCSIVRYEGLVCVGPDSKNDEQQLLSSFVSAYRGIIACLNAKEGVQHGWRVSKPHRFESRGTAMVVFTDASHYDADGRNLHISLEIQEKPTTDLRVLSLSLKYYDLAKLLRESD